MIERNETERLAWNWFISVWRPRPRHRASASEFKVKMKVIKIKHVLAASLVSILNHCAGDLRTTPTKWLFFTCSKKWQLCHSVQDCQKYTRDSLFTRSVQSSHCMCHLLRKWFVMGLWPGRRGKWSNSYLWGSSCSRHTVQSSYWLLRK